MKNKHKYSNLFDQDNFIFRNEFLLISFHGTQLNKLLLKFMKEPKSKKSSQYVEYEEFRQTYNDLPLRRFKKE